MAGVKLILGSLRTVTVEMQWDQFTFTVILSAIPVISVIPLISDIPGTSVVSRTTIVAGK